MSAAVLGLVDRIAAVFGAGKTTRSAAEDFGPPPGAVYREQLQRFTDADLYAMDRDVVLDKIRRAAK